MKHIGSCFLKAFLMIVCACGFSLNTHAISGPEFEKIISSMKDASTESISLREPTFSRKQITKFGETLSESGGYFTELRLLGILRTSVETQTLFTRLKENNTILYLDVSGSYLSDASVDALIGLLSDNSGNRSVLERVILDGVMASETVWLRFAENMENFRPQLQEISMQSIKMLPAVSKNAVLFDEMLSSMANSLSTTKRLTLNISGNLIEDKAKIAFLEKNTPHLVQVRFDERVWSMPDWVKLGFGGTAGFIIGTLMAKQ